VDTSFIVRNIGWLSDTITVTIDPGNLGVDTAMTAVPTSFIIAARDSQKITVTFRPALLQVQYYGTQVIVDAKATAGQKQFQKNFVFQVVTGIDDQLQVPVAYSLEQNYPNPFNGSSDIAFQVADAGWVRLSVSDLLGREVATLVDEKKQPGRYHAEWNAGNCPSGVYFCRMTAGDFVQVRRMLLLR
jgi:hypothetical protein